MGISMMGFKSCSTNYTPPRPAPNPDPRHWTLVAKHSFDHGYVLIVRYHDCTNFEGLKCMVYRGKFSPARSVRNGLDPHFTDEPDSPIARFRPDEKGVRMAKALAMSLDPA